MPEPSRDEPPSQRLDKWLWTARFFKTRSLAAEAISGGKVHVDGQRVKPARALRPGSEVRVRKGSWEITVVVQQLCPRRVSAKKATGLYLETQHSRAQREAAAEQRRAEAARPAGAGRPTKKDRRDISRLTGR